ncbi:hypothetical protein [Bacteriovorax sp. DB6_IX]|uniref:hypothetical protein n=1 Tax=Bacteriovorax sp. DB6_IX TaxID=1353530 RepID=UPI00038A0619|nr:hypothetical protein [Bacteriovorax sp. DB6_IX]EQC52333.1 hypothetical protein M901_2520 [Bacteriovorax sp. DB6_IX]
MIIDVDIDKFTGGFKVQFPLNQFNDDSDLKMAILLINTFAHEMELDPELGPDDMEEIVEKTKELGKDRFTVEISEDDIEVDI